VSIVGWRWHSICLATTGVLACCASPPEHLYALDDEPLERVDARPYRDTLLLGPVRVPEEVDRPQIVVSDAGSEVSFNEQQRWAGPLKDAIPRLLATDLSRDSPYRFVTVSSGTAGSPKARVAVDIYRFEVSRTRGATVAARWLYVPQAQQAKQIAGDAVGTASIAQSGYAGLVDALQRATSDLAHQMAGQLPTP
jgi:uncharacterized protein